MRSSYLWRLFSMLPLLGAVACGESGRVDLSTLEHTATGPRLQVTILGTPADPRIAPVREAIAHWNGEFLRLGRRVQLDSGTIRNRSVPDSVLSAASDEVVFRRGPAAAHLRLRESLSGVPGDILIALSDTNLVSFGVPWRAGSQGVVVVRRSDTGPLSLPNTFRNVVAHELGHVLGLMHNGVAGTLMCGRSAPCGPKAFASDSAYFFQLTPQEDARLRERWP